MELDLQPENPEPRAGAFKSDGVTDSDSGSKPANQPTSKNVKGKAAAADDDETEEDTASESPPPTKKRRIARAVEDSDEDNVFTPAMSARKHTRKGQPGSDSDNSPVDPVPRGTNVRSPARGGTSRVKQPIRRGGRRL